MSQNIVKYGYALLDSEDGKVIGIDSLNAEMAYSHKFFCPLCHEPMYPTFGSIQLHHFRHIGEKCEPDKYLHALAEKVFEEEYRKCLKNGIPFLLEIHSHVDCHKECIHNRNEFCLKHENTQIVDLAKTFTEIERESRVEFDDHYRTPDLLLYSERGEQLWIEIWVKHETEEKKRDENRILEIKVSSEDDLAAIKKHRITITGKDKRISFNCNFPKECIVKEDVYDMIMCADQARYVQKKPFIYRKTASKQVLQVTSPMDLSNVEWVDLGLPSGTLWAKNSEDVSMSFHAALQSFLGNLPSEDDVDELRKYCSRQFDSSKKEMVLTGPNNKTISFKCQEKYSSYWLDSYESKYDIGFGKCYHLGQDNTFYVNNKDSSSQINVHLVKH